MANPRRNKVNGKSVEALVEPRTLLI